MVTEVCCARITFILIDLSVVGGLSCGGAGTNVTVVKEAQSSFDPFSFSLGRFVIAAVFFTPFLSRAFKNKSVFRAGVELGIWASLAYITQSVGLITTEAGRAAFIGTFTVSSLPAPHQHLALCAPVALLAWVSTPAPGWLCL